MNITHQEIIEKGDRYPLATSSYNNLKKQYKYILISDECFHCYIRMEI